MNRRQAITLGLVSAAAPGLLAGKGKAQGPVGGTGGLAFIGEKVLSTPTRANTVAKDARKVLGISLVVQVTAPDGILPFDVSLFLERKVGNDWEAIQPADNPMGRAYASAIGGVVDYAIVRSTDASVSLFIPYEALPFHGEQPYALGAMRFLLRFFPYSEQQKRFVLDQRFDRPFAEDEYILRERDGATAIIRSTKSFRGMERSLFMWDLSADNEAGF